MSLSARSIAFPNIVVGQWRVDSVQIDNTGLDTLKVDSVRIDDSQYSVPAIPRYVQPGTHAPLTIRFSPRIAGQYLTHLRIYSNAPGSPDTVTLTGLSDPRKGLKTLEGSWPQAYYLVLTEKVLYGIRRFQWFGAMINLKDWAERSGCVRGQMSCKLPEIVAKDGKSRPEGRALCAWTEHPTE